MYHLEKWKWLLKYLDYGWSIIPLQGKCPMVPWKVYQARRPSKELWRRWIRAFPECNLGLVTGPVSNIYAIDLDSKENEKKFLQLIDGPPETPCYETARARRYLFRSEKRHNLCKTELFEFFGEGGQVVLPPSIHVTQINYAWVLNYSPEDVRISELPVSVQSLLSSNTHSKISCGEISYIKEGDRNSTLFKYAGALLRIGVPIDEIRRCLNIFNERCSPPLEDKELATISASIERYRSLTS